MHKALLSAFVAQNPFPDPLTLGFFYREKMRAIHQIAPDHPFEDILEVGGGRSGLTRLLYPQARVINIDLNVEHATSPLNQHAHVRFLCGDATALSFKSGSFDAVTMFDLLEHVAAHEKAVAEALRVLRPGGFLLISSPNENWRFPYYAFMKPICPPEAEMFAAWGHVRRGYSLRELQDLIPLPCHCFATFISPITVLCHDVAFSRLSLTLRRRICLCLSPLTWLGHFLHKPENKGTETASAWRKEAT